jgi:hypothetical protein
MTGHRTCILCLPRSGSQLCERLVSEIHNAFSLNEYFENWNQSEYVLDTSNTIFLRQFNMIPSSFNITLNFEEKLDLLKQVNINQPMILRIFLMDHYNKDDLMKIISELNNIGFEFITLTRDIKEQLLSYMIVRTYVKNVFGINSEISDPVHININDLRKVLTQIYISHLLWENNLSILLRNVEHKQVKYESIYSDMENIYNTKFKYLGKKSIKGDPFDLIINKKEVMNFLTNL